MIIFWRIAAISAACFVLSACSKSSQPVATDAGSAGVNERVVNVYNWTDYIGAHTIADFEKDTGIKVRYDNYDSNETLEAKLLTGSSGYDVVVPSANFLEKQIKAGVYAPLDKAKLPNLVNMDAEIMRRLQAHDPDNAHALNYMWGTTGVGYNVEKIKKLMPAAPLDSWRMVFDPTVVKNFTSCGVAVLDSPSEVTDMVLAFLGKDPNSQKPDDLKMVEAVLMSVRPYIKYIHSSKYIEDLASGEICVAIGYNGDILQARERAKAAKSAVDVAYFVPKEGSIIWFDAMAIPNDAPHKDNAHVFINYMMRPEIIAAVSNLKMYANGNKASVNLVDKVVREDAGVYPTPEVMQRLAPNLAKDEEFVRLQTRVWTKFSTGQ